MESELHITAIGTASQDVFLSSTAFKPHKVGLTLEEQFPLGEKLAVEQLTFSTGGNAMNAAITFARQGLHSEFIGLIGTEPAGEAIVKEFSKEGVAISHLIQHEQYRTSYSTILISPDGERTILNFPGTKLGEQNGGFDLSSVNNCDWLYLSSIKNMSLLHQIVKQTQGGKVKIAFNPSGVELEHRDQLHTILRSVELLIVNKEEAQEIVSGQTIEELAEKLAQLVPIAVVTDGSNGATIINQQRSITAGLYERVEVIDRTGAGDAFGSGIVAAIARGKTLEEAITFASANSTSVVTKVGATAGILHLSSPIHSMPLTIKDRNVSAT